jgi:hypothetical protein
MNAIATLKGAPGWRTLLQAAGHLTSRTGGGLLCLLHCAKMRQTPSGRNFLLPAMPETKLTVRPSGVSFYLSFGGFA